jgi:hypothetical protein
MAQGMPTNNATPGPPPLRRLPERYIVRVHGACDLVQHPRTIRIQPLDLRQLRREQLRRHDIWNGRVQVLRTVPSGRGIGEPDEPRGLGARLGVTLVGDDQRLGLHSSSMSTTAEMDCHVTPAGAKAKTGKACSTSAMGPCIRSADENRSVTT